MEEELLNIIEKMEAAGESEQSIAEVVQAYNSQKKKSDSIPPTPVGGSSSASTSLDSPEPKKNSIWRDIGLKLNANTRKIMGDMAGLPMQLYKGAMNSVIEMVEPEVFNDLESMSEQDRESFYQNMFSATSPFGAVSAAGSDVQEGQSEKIKELEQRMTQYDTAMSQDLVQGNIGQGLRRFTVEGIGAIPGILQAMVPVVGLGSVGAGTFSGKMEELETENKIGLAETTNAATIGVATALLEKYTTKVGKEIFRAFGKVVKPTKEAATEYARSILDGFVDVIGGARKEGGNEALESGVEMLADAILLGDKMKTEEIIYGLLDSFILGAGTGGGMQSVKIAAQNLARKRANEAFKEDLDPSDTAEPIDLEPVEVFATEQGNVESVPSAESFVDLDNTDDTRNPAYVVKDQDGNEIARLEITNDGETPLELQARAVQIAQTEVVDKIAPVKQDVQSAPKVKKRPDPSEPKKAPVRDKDATEKAEVFVLKQETNDMLTEFERQHVADAKGDISKINEDIREKISKVDEDFAKKNEDLKKKQQKQDKASVFVRDTKTGVYTDQTTGKKIRKNNKGEWEVKEGRKTLARTRTLDEAKSIIEKEANKTVTTAKVEQGRVKPDVVKETTGRYKDNSTGTVISRVASDKWELKDTSGKVVHTAPTLTDAKKWLDKESVKAEKTRQTKERAAQKKKEAEALKNKKVQTKEEIMKEAAEKKAKAAQVAKDLAAASKDSQKARNQAEKDAWKDMTSTERANILIEVGRKGGQTDQDIVNSIENETDRRTAEIMLAREAHEKMTPEAAAKGVKRTNDASRQAALENEAKAHKPLLTFWRRLGDLFLDRQMSVKDLLSKAGMKNTITFLINRSGASGNAADRTRRVNEKAFDGLNDAQLDNLEDIIIMRSIIDTDRRLEKSGKPPVKHPNGMTGVMAEKALDQYKKDLGEKEFNDMMKRADAVFEEYKSHLDEMLEEGIINQGSYDSMIDFDYQRRQFLDHLMDMRGNYMKDGEASLKELGLSEAQIKALTGGSEGLMLTDSQLLISSAIYARTKAKYDNRVNKTLAKEFLKGQALRRELEKKKDLTKKERNRLKNLQEIQRALLFDKILEFDDNGKPVYKYKSTPKRGFKSLYYYENGVANRIWVREDVYNKLNDLNNRIISASATQKLQIATGVTSVKALATGYNPFFLVTNVPRDIAFAATFSPEFNNNFLGNVLKIAAEGAKHSVEVLYKGKNSEVAQLAIDNGLKMDFLTVQGRANRQQQKNTVSGIRKSFVTTMRKTPVLKEITKVVDFLFKDIGEASEIATRLVVFEKAIKNRLKERGVSFKEMKEKGYTKILNEMGVNEKNLILAQAVRAARSLTDFAQGGTVTKLGDTFIPYLNAATQGTRSAIELGMTLDGEFSTVRTLSTSFRLAQAGVVSSATMVGMSLGLISVVRDDEDEEVKKMDNLDIYFETMMGVSDYDIMNYYIVPTGDRDERGEWGYLRVAKAQAMTPVLSAVHEMQMRVLAEAYDKQYEKKDLLIKMARATYSNMIPIQIDQPVSVPVIDAMLAWGVGFDTFKGDFISKDHGRVHPIKEGRYDETVDEWYRDLDYRPARMQAALESMITTPSTNPAIGAFYWAAEGVTDKVQGESPEEGKGFKTLEKLGSNIVRRMYKYTSPYNRNQKIFDIRKNAEPEVLQAYENEMKTQYVFTKIAMDIKSKGLRKDKDIDSLAERYLEKYELVLDPMYKSDAVRSLKKVLAKGEIIPLVEAMKRQSNPEVKAFILSDAHGDLLMRPASEIGEAEDAIIEQMKDAGIITDEIVQAYVRRWEKIYQEQGYPAWHSKSKK